MKKKQKKTSKTSFFATHWVTPIGITIVSHLAHRRVSCVRAWRASRSVLVFAFQGGHADEVSRWDAELAFPSSRHLQRLLPSRLYLPAGIFRTDWLTQTWTVVSVSVWQRVLAQHSARMSDSGAFPQGLSLPSEAQHKGASLFLHCCSSLLKLRLLLKYLSKRV